MYTNPFYEYANFFEAKITAKYEVILQQIIIWVYKMCNGHIKRLLKNDVFFPEVRCSNSCRPSLCNEFDIYVTNKHEHIQHNWFVNIEQQRAQWAEIKCCSMIRTNVFAHNGFNLRAYVPFRPLQSSNLRYMVQRLATPSNSHVRLRMPNKMKS